MATKPGLGRGLDALLSSSNKPTPTTTESADIQTLSIEMIQRGAFQPRKNLDPDALQELSNSIKAQGVIQPIIVRQLAEGQYEIIAGERRWRASQMAGLHDIPVIIRNLDDQTTAAFALIENIQREDLNSYEESLAISRLINEFQLTHQQVAEAIGKSRTAVTNLLRLQELTSGVLDYLMHGKIDMGHARALLALPDELQLSTADEVANKQLSVRATESLVKNILRNDGKAVPQNKPIEVEQLEQKLAGTLGARVNIQYNKQGKGKLVIEYNSLDELDGILTHIK